MTRFFLFIIPIVSPLMQCRLQQQIRPTSGIPSMTCPLAMTSAGTPVAAIAEHMAYLQTHFYGSAEDTMLIAKSKMDCQFTGYIADVRNTDQKWQIIMLRPKFPKVKRFFFHLFWATPTFLCHLRARVVKFAQETCLRRVNLLHCCWFARLVF